MRIASPETTKNVQRPENVVRSSEVSRTQSREDAEHSNQVTASDNLDKVELSPEARDIQRAREVAQGAPGVREDKVAAARRALQSGKLNLKGQELAEKMLKEISPQLEQ